ncbi:hypothetical protein IMG5_156060 [Ichthyophthirius multifiliis]|uniref:Uncharacterized protein n=1 Tax=Ichthyophthirius multifiliis TaxID=5932 RepID=G0QZE4_ICHMU|nr:hypothetical protein IMG5_156060 [Ichthyophthirius multifiliis]EGR29413.1 hypothetical protein IMG5_156060 [Ichthyophthirius multifiliis]|eukprot:XP_004030649.1 hypothetical protein IMG5_156060 [Ichthyophthirius multifiliis]
MLQIALQQSMQDQQIINPDQMTYEQLLELEERNGKVNKGLKQDQIDKIKVSKYILKQSLTYTIHAYFLTVHQYPLKDAQVIIELDNQKFQLTPSPSTGLIQHTSSLSSISSSKEGKITLVVGQSPYQIINVFPITLDSTNNIKQTFYLKPEPYPKPTTVKGCVYDRFGKAFPKVEVTISYDKPIFQDQVVLQSDITTGCFENIQDLKEFIPIEGNIIAERSNYPVYNLIQNSLNYKTGFYILNDLKFQLDEKIILKTNSVPINIKGQIKDQDNQPLNAVEVKLEKCNSQTTLLKKIFYKKKKNIDFSLSATSDSKGDFAFLSENSPFLISQNSPIQTLQCQLIITKPHPYQQSIIIKESNYFDNLPLSIKLTPQKIQGKVSGKLVDSVTKLPLQGVQVLLEYNDKVQKQKLQALTDSGGAYSFNIQGYTGLEYIGNITFSKNEYKTITQDLKLNDQNKFTLDLGNIQLIYISVQGKVSGKLVDSITKLYLQGVQILLEYNDKDQNQKLQALTDSKGAFQINIHGQIGLEYIGKATFSKSEYESKSLELKLNDQNKFTEDLGIISLVYQPNMQEITIQGKIQEDNMKQTPLKDVKILIKILSKADNKLQTLTVISNQTGVFSLKIQLQEKIMYEITIEINDLEHFITFLSKKDITVSTTTKLIDFLIIKLKRKSIPALISGQLIDSKTQKPIINSKIQISTSPSLEQPIPTTSSSSSGSFSINFIVLSGLQYSYALLVTQQTGQVGSFQGPDPLSFTNKYKIENLKAVITNKEVTATVSGIFIEKSQQKPVENADVFLIVANKINRCQQKTSSKGEFSCQVVLDEGPQYTYFLDFRTKIGQKVIFKDNSLILSKDNKYKMENHNLQLLFAQTKAQINAVLINKKNQKPISEANIQIEITPQISTSSTNQQTCPSSNDKGAILCEFQVDDGVSYTFMAKIQAKNGQKGSFSGNINPTNQYISQSGHVSIDLIEEMVNASIQGSLKDQQGQKIVEKSFLEILTVENKEEPNEKVFFAKTKVEILQGNFNAKINLTKGFSYKVCILFTSDNFLETNQCFGLDQTNNYLVQNAQVTLISPIKLVLTGKVQTMRKRPINAAKIIVFFAINKQEFAIISDKNGDFVLNMVLKLKDLEQIKGQLKVQAKGFEEYTQDLIFEKNKNFKIEKLQINMNSMEFQHELKGQVVEKQFYGIKNVQIILILKDSKKEQKLTSISEKKGFFTVKFNINNNEEYEGAFHFVHDFFYSKIYNFKLLSENNYVLPFQKYNLDRKIIMLTLKAKIINIFHQPLANAIAEVQIAAVNSNNQDEVEEDEDISVNTFKQTVKSQSDEFGKVIILQEVEVGYQYMCRTSVTITDDQYEESFEKIDFNYENSYLVEDSIIVMYRQKNLAKVSGKVLFNKKALENAFVHLDVQHIKEDVNFGGKSHILDKQNYIKPIYTDSEGLFIFSFYKEYGYSYDINITAQYPGTQDAQKTIHISVLNKYVSENNVIKLHENTHLTQGYIKGHTVDNMNNILPNCEIFMYNETRIQTEKRCFFLPKRLQRSRFIGKQ